MAAVEVPQTLEYRGGQLNVAPVLEVKIFTNWKKRFMCYINGIEPLFENIIKNGPFVPMKAGQRKPENQWTGDERKAANLDQRLKSLIMSVLPDDQMNSDEEEVSSDDSEMVKVKVLVALAEENDAVSKEGARNGEWIKISMRKVHTLLEMKDNDDKKKVCLDYLCIDLNYVEEKRSNLLSKHRNLVHELNACKEQLLVLKQAKLDFLIMQNTTDSSVSVTDSSATDYDSADGSSVCSIPLPPLKKLDGAKPISGPKTIKSILRSKSTFKDEALKHVIINEPSQLLLRVTKALQHQKIISLERKIDPRNPRHAFKKCKACGSPNLTTTDQYDIEWFKRGEALQAKKAEALKSTRVESSNANRSKTPTKS
nr:hypothetical protein [Tanacetum cinerariifolium]